MAKKIIIAIDGFSSCGKSTLAKDLAKKLKYNYIDSGAMYRAVTLYCLQNAININKEEEVVAALPKIKITFKHKKTTNKSETYLNGKNVELAIRSMEVANQVGIVSKYKKVRQFLVEKQKEFGKEKGLVMDGRDIGTVVFPDAALKLFITSNMNVRVERRYNELKEKGIKASKEEIEQNLEERDNIDMTRKESPLLKAEGAREIDNSILTMEEQVEIAFFFTKEVLKKIKK